MRIPGVLREVLREVERIRVEGIRAEGGFLSSVVIFYLAAIL